MDLFFPELGVRQVDECEDILLSPCTEESHLLKPADGTSHEDALSLTSRTVKVRFRQASASKFDFLSRVSACTWRRARSRGHAGCRRSSSVSRTPSLRHSCRQDPAKAWASLPSFIASSGTVPMYCSCVLRRNVSPCLRLVPWLHTLLPRLCLALNPVRVRGVDLTIERVGGNASFARASGCHTSTATVAGPMATANMSLGVDRVIIWHDIENAPLPSKIILRDAAGNRLLGPHPQPFAKRPVLFTPVQPDRSDEIRGGVIVETLRTALACVAPGGAAHPALAVDGATLRHSLAQFEYRVFLEATRRNPFHPSIGEWRHIILSLAR